MKISNHRLVRDDGTPYPFRDTPNKGGIIKPRWLVMHYTAGRSAAESIGWLANAQAKASAHVVIDKKGAITQMVAFNQKAWHAGESTWKGVNGLNSHSIGIELDGFGMLTGGPGKWKFLEISVPDSDVLIAAHRNEPGVSRAWAKYPPAQVAAALELAKLLVRSYGLEDVIGHDDIAPKRKTDPGPAFDLAGFRAAAMGAPAPAPAPVPDPARRVPPGEVFVVMATHLNVRSGPGAGNPTVAGSPLPKGAIVEELADSGGWKQVRARETGTTGWVSAQFLAPAIVPLDSLGRPIPA
jgi:N-acetylmuramoyl-L-alanine amidase